MAMLHVLVLLCFGHIAHSEEGQVVQSNTSVKFVRLGKTYGVQKFATLINTFNLSRLENAYDNLHDEFIALYQYDNNLVYNITWINSSNRTDIEKQHYFQIQNIYSGLDTLFRLIFANNSTDILQHANHHNILRKWFVRQRRDVANTVVPIITKLVGLGIGTIKKYAASRIYDSRFETNLVQTMQDKNLKLSHQYDFLKQIASRISSRLAEYKLSPSKAARKTELKKSQKDFTLQIQLFEKIVKTYIELLASLFKQRIPLTILNKKMLKINFDTLIQKVQNEGYFPLNRDFTSIYKEKTITYYQTSPDKLLITFTLIPISKGPLMNIYQYIPSPIYLGNNIVAEIQSPKQQILALDEMDTNHKYFSKENIKQCVKNNDVYHCPNNQIEKRRHEDYCLYNLFEHNLMRILNTCKIDFNIISSKATKLKDNEFQIISTKPTRLTINCTPPKVHHLTGIHNFNLTKDCPEAYTSDDKFQYIEKTTLSYDILNLPISYNLTHWFPTIPINLIKQTINDFNKNNRKYITYHELYTKLNSQFSNIFSNYQLQISFGTTILLICILIFKIFCKFNRTVKAVKKRKKLRKQPIYVPMKRKIPVHHATPQQIQKFNQNRLETLYPEIP